MVETVAFTGHRQVPEGITARGLDRLLGTICPRLAIVGGAGGADTIAAERCWESKVPYIMALPHESYPDVYGLRDDPRWRSTCLRASEIVIVVQDQPWHFSHNFKRNEWMVDHSEILISISKFDPMGNVPRRGGTAHCVRYARKVRRPIEWLDIEDSADPSQAPSLPLD